MFILRLKQVIPPHDSQAVCRSDDEQKLHDYVESQMPPPRIDVVDGVRCVRYFAAGSPLEDYALPQPGDAEHGVINLGTLEERTKIVIAEASVQIAKQVEDEWQKIIDNTVEV